MRILILTVLMFELFAQGHGGIIKLKSSRGDYLAGNQDGNIILTSKETKNSLWRVIDIGGNKINLQNVETGKFLHRPASGQKVTQWHSGVGNEWTVGGAIEYSSQITLKSFKDDFLHRAKVSDTPALWTVEAGGIIRLRSSNEDYLAADQDRSISLASGELSNHELWRIVDIGNNKISLQNVQTSKFLHRTASGKVTTWHAGVGNEWTINGIIDYESEISLRSFKDDFLYRANFQKKVTVSNIDNNGKLWTVECCF